MNEVYIREIIAGFVLNREACISGEKLWFPE